MQLPNWSEIKELIAKNEKDERKLSLNVSYSSKRFSIGEESNLKIFNNFLNDFNKKATQIEKNETDYFKLIPKKEDK